MSNIKDKNNRKLKRRSKIRSKIKGTGKCPRLSVFKSNTRVFIQLIDDLKGLTVVSAGMNDLKKDDKKTKVEQAFELGKVVAKKAIDKKITKIVFDRGGNKYHGRVKAVADGAREIGLKF
ncbi:50S ribosomal protein L18 [Candidatus Parcubacteria bacterium]|nr:50S ribosomal protein L18 [Candidatus Parcubacteria bacterium]